MELKEKLSNLIEEIYSINSDIESIKSSNYIETKKLQRENKELKEKVAYLELNKEGIEQKDDILFKQNEDLREKIVYLRKQILNYEYGKNAIDMHEKNELIKQNEDLKQLIENLEGELTLKSNLLSEQKEENKHLKITLKLSKNKILELKDLYEQEKDKNYKTLESEELKQENRKLKEKMSIIKGIIYVQHKR